MIAKGIGQSNVIFLLETYMALKAKESKGSHLSKNEVGAKIHEY